MNKKLNASLIVALSLPIVMIVAVALSVYVPSRFQTFHGQFLYAVPQSPYGVMMNGYRVVNGKLQEPPTTLARPGVYPSTGTCDLYVHDLATNVSRDITLEEAKHLNLDPSPRSQEGLQIDYGNREEEGLLPFFFFAAPDYSAVYVKGNHGSLKLNVRLHAGAYYSNQMQFIGWVKS